MYFLRRHRLGVSHPHLIKIPSSPPYFVGDFFPTVETFLSPERTTRIIRRIFFVTEWEPPTKGGSRRARRHGASEVSTRVLSSLSSEAAGNAEEVHRVPGSPVCASPRPRCSPEAHLRLTWPCCHSRGCGTTSATCRLLTRGGVIIKGQRGGRSARITIV